MTLYITGAVLVGIAILLVLWQLPKFQMRSLRGPTSKVPTDRIAELEDKSRATLAQIIGGILLLGTIYTTWMGIFYTKEAQDIQSRITRDGQITDRYAKAVELLSAPRNDTAKHLGGIYALERIARDSDAEHQDHWTIIQILTAYVRTNAPAMKGTSITKSSSAKSTSSDESFPADIQAILTVLGRRVINSKTHPEYGPIDLQGTDLRGADLHEAHLEGADFSNAQLGGRIGELPKNKGFHKAYLDGAKFRGADLTGTDFRGAHLNNANLSDAIVTAARFDDADLQQASLFNCNGLMGAYLIHTRLEGADLRLTGITKQKPDMDGAFTDTKTLFSPH